MSTIRSRTVLFTLMLSLVASATPCLAQLGLYKQGAQKSNQEPELDPNRDYPTYLPDGDLQWAEDEDSPYLPVSVYIKSIRSNDFKVLLDDGTALNEYDSVPLSGLWGGEVQGVEDSNLFISSYSGLYAFASAPGRETYIYDGITLTAQTQTLGAQMPSQGFGTPIDLPAEPPVHSLGALTQIITIAVECDYAYYAHLGSSVDRVIEEVEIYIGAAAEVFKRDAGILIELGAIVIRTTQATDPYDGQDEAEVMATIMQDVWAQSPLAEIDADQVKLFSGASLDMIDGAFIGMCNDDWRYGVLWANFSTEFVLRMQAISQLIAVNLGLPFCTEGDCGIMCPNIGSCSGDVTYFSDNEAAYLRYLASTTPCLRKTLVPGLLDPFTTSDFESALWPNPNGASINQGALGEPSPPFSANIDFNNNRSTGEALVTALLNLGGDKMVAVKFSTQHRGVEMGESLKVQYRTRYGTWVALGEIVSNGTDQIVFKNHRYILPMGALHDRGGIRLVANVNSADDEWFVDDFELLELPNLRPERYGQGSSDANAVQPTIQWDGIPCIGSDDFKIVAPNVFIDDVVLFLVGFSRANFTDGGLTLNVLPPWISVLNTEEREYLQDITLPVPIPNDPTLDGLHFMIQYLTVFDDLVGSRGLDIEICDPDA